MDFRKNIFLVVSASFLLTVLGTVNPACGQPEIPQFGETISITDTDTASLLSRTSSGSIALAEDGTLRIVYTEKNATGTSVGNPGAMYYRVFQGGQWNTPLAIRSTEGNGVPFNSGGNPAMLVDSDRSIHFVWHDYRHSTSTSGTNQLEIYYRKLSPDGTLSDEIRLTDNAKNSHRTKITKNSLGQLIVSWYDYSQNSLGDLLLAISDTNQVFPSDKSFESQVVSTANVDGAGVLLPQIALDSRDRLHVVWTTAQLDGVIFSNEKLVYGVMENPSQRVMTHIQQLSPRGTLSTDAARICIANDDSVWVVWSDYQTQVPQIMLAQKSSTTDQFGEPIVIVENDLPDMLEQPNLAVAPDGIVYVVWSDYRTGEGDIYLRTYDPRNGTISEPVLLSDADQNPDVIPAIDVNPALDINSQGQIVVVWERTVEKRTNLVMRLSQSSKVSDWSLLQ
jgi:hypothetical protein